MEDHICPVCPSTFHLQVCLTDLSHKHVLNFYATNIMAAVTVVCGGVMLCIQYSETQMICTSDNVFFLFIFSLLIGKFEEYLLYKSLVN
jgi:hypothetical protein